MEGGQEHRRPHSFADACPMPVLSKSRIYCTAVDRLKTGRRPHPRPRDPANAKIINNFEVMEVLIEHPRLPFSVATGQAARQGSLTQYGVRPAVLLCVTAAKCVHCTATAHRSAMIIPVRCFTCGKVIGNKWETYLSLLQADFNEGDALDELGLKRYCCRRMVLTHVDLIEKLLNYNCECLSCLWGVLVHTQQYTTTTTASK